MFNKNVRYKILLYRVSHFNPPVAIILKHCIESKSVPSEKLMVPRGTSDAVDFATTAPQGGREQGSTSEIQMETPIFFANLELSTKKTTFCLRNFFRFPIDGAANDQKSSFNFKFLVDCSAIYCKSKKMS